MVLVIQTDCGQFGTIRREGQVAAAFAENSYPSGQSFHGLRIPYLDETRFGRVGLLTSGTVLLAFAIVPISERGDVIRVIVEEPLFIAFDVMDDSDSSSMIYS